MNNYVWPKKVDVWIDELKPLFKIATLQPHAAYVASIHYLTNKWLFPMRTVPNAQDSLVHLERGYTNFDHRSSRLVLQSIFTLPARLSGLGTKKSGYSDPIEYKALLEFVSQKSIRLWQERMSSVMTVKQNSCLLEGYKGEAI